MRILVVLVLSISISLLGFMVYLDLNEEKIAQKSPFIAFPSNPLFLLEINEITSTWNHFTETNMIWSEFTSHKDSLIQYMDIEKISQFLNDERVAPLINKGRVYVGGYAINSKIELLFIQNIYEKDNEYFSLSDSIFTSLLPTTLMAKYIAPFIILSSNEELIKNSIEQIIGDLPVSNALIQEKTKKLASKSGSFSCFIDVAQVNELLFSFDSSAISYLENEKGISNWFQFDFNYTPNAINIIGVSDCVNQNLQTTPQYINNASLVPDNIDILSKKRIKLSYDTASLDLTLGNNSVEELELLHLKLTNKFTKSEEELILIERPGSLAQDSYLANNILLDSVISNTFLSKEIRLVNSKFLKRFFQGDYINYNVCYIDNQYFIMSTYEGLKEWEYQLKQKKKISFDEAIFADRSASFLHQAFSQVNYWSGKEIKQRVNAFSFVKSTKFGNNILNEISGISWATSFLNKGYLHHAINIQKGLHEEEDQKILWTASVGSVFKGPLVMKNHKTGTKDILIQDTTNAICLYSASGKLKWQLSIDQPIIGSVSQIDIYSNNKWQMVFNTKDRLYVVDINGHNVDGFPIEFNYLATSPVGVIDYDLNKDYRFLVAGDNNKIHNYNIYGKKVKGWSLPKTSSTVSNTIQHFSIAGKDYVFISENNGTIQFLNRKGEKRHSSMVNTFIKPRSNFIIQKSYCIDSSSLVFIDSANQLQKKIFNGNGSSMDFSLDSTLEYRPFIYETSSSNLINYGFISNQKLMIYGPDKQVYLDKESGYGLVNNVALSSDNNYLILFNDKIDEIELIDNRFQEIPTLFRGTKNCTIGDLNNDGVDELITVINGSTLLCYQIAVSN
jgi:hypothetical protein